MKVLRKNNNLTQKELAEKLNVSGQAISNWERQKGYPDIANIIRISEIFNFSLDELIKEDGDLKKILLEQKVKKRTKMIVTILFLIAYMVILISSLFRIKTVGYKELNVISLIVGVLGTIQSILDLKKLL
ncbi:hypothetical protein CKN73_11045 [Carnobacterium divergens]|nr:helix-turn-helix transcriptional regulator [Carnobacterium divergens]TFJ38730.1 hypothetical protein CKN77_11140 [Carnobacterium divergens]TFJ47965.1 hypothetical protein CKN73_11045 [Carnobacterium divergens]TFJ52929.1 hypothetical protein CKN83_10945 [Carnobacterium divergens]TFJ58653.1 hypothetical protein CKN89_11390 [Carnobacterium divergens]TFJ68719.1 hypothetical protein CKN91_11000 [Carnobacterium divergens]